MLKNVSIVGLLLAIGAGTVAYATAAEAPIYYPPSIVTPEASVAPEVRAEVIAAPLPTVAPKPAPTPLSFPKIELSTPVATPWVSYPAPTPTPFVDNWNRWK